ncbi:hypothetical protein LJC63_05825, partial [Ruminococcaceae bacterium OttesenSCG-928-L11]|nr:hypothetical protein [Ruminococcaceae bacterium OttesenSCG-928-L11]
MGEFIVAMYTCDACHFTFERAGETESCPDCGKLNIREANAIEVVEYRRNRGEGLSMNLRPVLEAR